MIPSLRWKSTGKFFKTVGLRWVPTGRILTSNTTKVDSELPNGLNADITNQYECEQTLDVSAGTSNLIAGTSFNPKEEGLRVGSELRIHDHNNEPSSSKLVPNVVPPADKTDTSRQELEFLFHHHITMLSDVNPLFDKVLEDIECKDSYDPNLDESTFLVAPLFDSNEDEYFTPGDDVELLLLHDSSIPKMSVALILEGFIDEPPLEENNDLFDLESKNDEWKRILYDAQIDDLMSEDNNFDPGICVKIFSPTYVSLPFEDRIIFSSHMLSEFFFLISLIRWCLLFLSPSGVRILFLTPSSSLFIFLIESLMEICSSTCFTPNITMI
nr:hypothetical protein [Tanacetum cinerariifolium]